MIICPIIKKYEKVNASEREFTDRDEKKLELRKSELKKR
jgi:hypothetical protein